MQTIGDNGNLMTTKAITGRILQEYIFSLVTDGCQEVMGLSLGLSIIVSMIVTCRKWQTSSNLIVHGYMTAKRRYRLRFYSLVDVSGLPGVDGDTESL